MPPVNVLCPCSPDPQPCDHWRGDYGCTLPADQRAWYQALLYRQLHDTRHRDGKLTVTRLLTCPREWLLSDFLPYTFNPKSARTPHVGTLVQAEKAKFAPLGWVAEREVSGELWGLPVSASIDLSLLSGGGDMPPIGRISEGKFHAFDKDGRDPWSLKPDMIAQVNMQRLLWEQSEPGLQVVEMKVTRDSMAAKESATFEVPVWDLEQIGRHRPGGGDFTVKQIAGFAQQVTNLVNEDDGIDQDELVRAISDTPLVGLSMFHETKCTKYCAMRQVCDKVQAEHKEVKMRKGGGW